MPEKVYTSQKRLPAKNNYQPNAGASNAASQKGLPAKSGCNNTGNGNIYTHKLRIFGDFDNFWTLHFGSHCASLSIVSSISGSIVYY